MWWITCPICNHEAPIDDFEPSLSDECACPKCEAFFEVDLSIGDEENEDG